MDGHGRRATNALNQENRKYEWTKEQQAAFEQIKALLATAPMLLIARFDHQFVIQTDASDTGIGAVLLQEIDAEERERNGSVTERECLAVVWAIQKFRPYVEGYAFKVVTNHSSLKW